MILTGIGYDKSGSGTSLEAFRLNIADTVSPGRYPGRDSGYLFFADTVANAASFFHPGTFSKEILWYTQDIGQPLSAIELSTLATLDLAATSFTGPVSSSGVAKTYHSANMLRIGDDNKWRI